MATILNGSADSAYVPGTHPKPQEAEAPDYDVHNAAVFAELDEDSTGVSNQPIVTFGEDFGEHTAISKPNPFNNQVRGIERLERRDYL